jgi:rifampicin phosphotransferase
VLRKLVPTAVRFVAGVPGTLRRLPTFVADNPRRCAELTGRIAATADPAALARLWDDEVRPLVVTGSDNLGAAGRSDPVAPTLSSCCGSRKQRTGRRGNAWSKRIRAR